MSEKLSEQDAIINHLQIAQALQQTNHQILLEIKSHIFNKSYEEVKSEADRLFGEKLEQARQTTKKIL